MVAKRAQLPLRLLSRHGEKGDAQRPHLDPIHLRALQAEQQQRAGALRGHEGVRTARDVDETVHVSQEAVDAATGSEDVDKSVRPIHRRGPQRVVANEETLSTAVLHSATIPL